MASRFSMNRYPFLGGVPEHWGVVPFRRLFRESSEVNGPEPIGPMLSVSGYRGVEEKIYDSENRRRAPEEVETYRVVRPKQLAVNTMWMNYAGLGVSDLLGHMSPAYRAYNISRDLDPRYAHHLLRSDKWVSGYTAHATGVRPNSLQLSKHDLMSFPVLVPPKSEQRAIADYLDHEIAEIDAFTADLQRVSTLNETRLEAKLTTLLSNVTRWVSLSRIARLFTGSTPSSSLGLNAFDSEGIPWIRPGDIDLRKRVADGSQRLSAAGASGVRPLKGPGVLVVGIGATVGRVGFAQGAFATNQQITTLLPTATDAEYLYYAIRSLSDFIRQTAHGNTLPIVNNAQLSALKVPLPEPAEQARVATEMDSEMAQTLEASHEIDRAIDLVRERRAAIISAAVTGQIDVSERRKPVAEVLEDEVRERV